jgi:hypothetical protein
MTTSARSVTAAAPVPPRWWRHAEGALRNAGWLLFVVVTVWMLAERLGDEGAAAAAAGADGVHAGPIAAADAAGASGSARGAAEGASTVQFVARGLAVTRIGTALYDHPARGASLVGLAPGTRLDVGGYVDVPAGLWKRRVLWARLQTGDGPLFGFVPGDAAVVSIGEPPVLDMGAVAVADLLAPTENGGVVASGVGSPASPGPGVGAGATSELSIAWLPETVLRWEAPILAAARTHGVDPNLVAIVMLVESGGNPSAVSPSGALGLMQVMPATAADIAAQRGIDGHSVERLMEPDYNIDLGAWYLADMLRRFGRADDPDWQASVELAASAYNGGPGTVQRMLTAGTALPAESARYRRWVGTMWSQRGHAGSDGFDSWLAAGGAVLVDAARQSAGA